MTVDPLTSFGFGHAMTGIQDLDGDGINDYAVTSSGELMVFSGANHGEIWRVYGPNLTTLGGFGHALDSIGDLNGDGLEELIVSALKPHSGAFGEVFVLSGADGSIIYSWAGSPGDEFGNSVASGDFDGDGIEDIVACSGQASYSHYAHVFSGASGSLLQTFNGGTNDPYYGQSVACDDLDGDGYAEVIVGSPRSWRRYSNAYDGGVFIYDGLTGNQLLFLDGFTLADGKGIGWALDLVTDQDGDGMKDLVLGTYSSSGSVYVASSANGTSLSSLVTTERFFGETLAAVSDQNGDGIDDLVVGVGGTWDPHTAAYLHSGATLQRIGTYTGPDYFGSTVDNIGDLDGDGSTEWAFGTEFGGWGTPNRFGQVDIYGYSPYLNLGTSEISASAGGNLAVELDFPTDAGLLDYKVVISETGAGPTLYGVDVPLTQDGMVIDTFLGNYPVPNTTGMHGVLDAGGNASANMAIPANIPAGLVGNTYWFAAIANPTGALPTHSSAAQTVTIVL